MKTRSVGGSEAGGTGAGHFACWGLPPALLTHWVSPESRGVILGISRFMVDLGFILGSWTVSLALEGGGFRVAAWTVATLTGASTLAFFGLRGHSAPAIKRAGADVSD